MTKTHTTSSSHFEPQPSIWSWLRDVRILIMVLLGFSAGLPLLLIFSTLSLWLGEAGVAREAVTMFSWAALGYSFKFVWAPLVDQFELPWLNKKLGRRRSYLFLAQIGILLAIIGMAFTNPALGSSALIQMALWATLLGFSAATQDIVIDAYRIEIAPIDLQGTLSSAYIAGYRIGLIVTGAGALYLADRLGTSKEHYQYTAWSMTYLVMAASMGVGLLTTLMCPEPLSSASPISTTSSEQPLRLFGLFLICVLLFIASFWGIGQVIDSLFHPTSRDPIISFGFEVFRLASALGVAFLGGWGIVGLGWVPRTIAHQTWLLPIQNFFQRYGFKTAWLILSLIGLYRISDIVMGAVSNVFYQDMGYSKVEIANAVKLFGVIVSILGGFLGGMVATRWGVMRTLFLGAILSALTNLGFTALALHSKDLIWLYGVVVADNLASGFASAAFVTFLSSLTHVSFTAVQYAIFSSLMTLLPKVLAGYSGSMVAVQGYPWFFVGTALMGLPVLLLIGLVYRAMKHANK